MNSAASIEERWVATWVLKVSPISASIQDNFGESPLHKVIFFNFSIGTKKEDHEHGMALLDLFLKYNPNCAELQDLHGNTILHLAFITKNIQLIQLILKRCPRFLTDASYANLKNKEGDTVLHIASMQETLNGMRNHIEKKRGDTRWTPEVAFRSDDELGQITNKILEKCPQLLSERNNEDETPLSLAVKRATVRSLNLTNMTNETKYIENPISKTYIEFQKKIDQSVLKKEKCFQILSVTK